MHRFALTGLALATAATTSLAQVTVYTDRAAWEAAVGGAFSLENFNDLTTGDILDGATLDTGVLQITRDGSPNNADGALAISPGTLFGNIDGTNFLDGETGASPHERVDFRFNGQAVFAFGADFTSPFSGDGIGIEFAGEVFLLDGIGGGASFFGLVSSGDVASVVSIVGSPDAITFQELWQADNFVYAVPAPASAALLGLGGLVATRRRR